MATVACAEGDWFAVPLRTDGFATGVVARRKGRSPVLFGYFFGPVFDVLPTLDRIATSTPGDAVLIGRFGHLGIVEGRWPLLGRPDGWDRSAWPMVPLVRRPLLTDDVLLVRYADDDPNREVSVERAVSSATGPADGMMGHAFVEERMTRLLS